jgi:excisionase family DNA binding protein
MRRTSEQPEALLEINDDRAIQPMLTRDATAAYLAVSTRTLDRLVQAGDLHAYRIGGHRRFRIADVDSYIKSRME